MAENTSTDLRGKLIYQIYVRNYSKSGTFQAVIDDLPRITSLGTDYIYLTPIHPISKKNRKGDLGSPYAVSDYYAINPELGTLSDFQELVAAVHNKGLKLLIDIVINHTGADHYYTEKHPEFYYKRADGSFGNKVGNWTDIYDFNYDCPKLWDELIKMLTYWANMGVDGFRCDVASLVPVSFWQRARRELEQVRPGLLWFAESVHANFIREMRSFGCIAHSDCELYSAFDICYDYDIHEYFEGYLTGAYPLVSYKLLLEMQDAAYPTNYVKARCLENHDFQRIHHLTGGDKAKTINWLAYSFFHKGIAFVYAGQECYAEALPNLFSKDPVVWNVDEEYCALIRKLKEIKNHPVVLSHTFEFIDTADNNVLYFYYEKGDKRVYGLFNVGLQEGCLDVHAPDGEYVNMLDGSNISVSSGQVVLGHRPLIFEV